MAIVKPENMNFTDKNIIMIISGSPGVGKSTLALSAPDAVLIDADEGIVRVNPAHRKDTSICKTYEELLTDIKNFQGHYKTVVVDTGGSLIEMLKDWAVRTEPSASKKSGGFSQQGFGFVKQEFLRLSAELKRNYNVIYIFHVSKNKQNEEVFYDLVCEGSAKTLVYQPADLAGYLHIVNSERYIGFTPTMNYNAKSAYGIKGLIKVPELGEGDENNFLTLLLDKIRANLAAESAGNKKQQEAYQAAMQAGQAVINAIETAEQALPALNEIRTKITHALTSQKELENAFKSKMAELGLVYDGKVKAYVAKVKE